MMRSSQKILVVLFALPLAVTCRAAPAQEKDPNFFRVMRGDDAQLPPRLRPWLNWHLVQTDGKVFLARDKVPDRRTDAGALGGWIAPDFVEKSDAKKGTVYLADGKPNRKALLQYPLHGDSTEVTCGNKEGFGTSWEWALEGVHGYFLKPTEGKYAGWFVDFGDPEDAIRTMHWVGEDPEKIRYVRRPAKLTKEPGKFSALFLFYYRKGGFDPERDVGK